MSDTGSEVGGSGQSELFVIRVSEHGSATMEFKLSGEFMANGVGYNREGTIAALKEAIDNPDCEVEGVDK